jgi:hypothetical protein
MNQISWVQTQLKKGKILTQIDAFNGCGTIRLAVHIEVLRSRGLNIITHRRIAKNGSRYAAYQLIKGKK